MEITIDPKRELMFIKLADHPVAESWELIEMTLVVDVDAQGTLIGLEVLSPGALSELEELLAEERVNLPANFHTIDLAELEARFQREIALCRR